MVEVVSNANSLTWHAMSDMASMVGDGLIALASILESLDIVNLCTVQTKHTKRFDDHQTGEKKM